MIGLVEQNSNTLKNLCKHYNVRKLELFGSALEPVQFDNEKSDLDFLIEFLPMTPTEHSQAYFGLLEALQDLFNHPIDLVEIKAIRNPYFIESINRNRKEIYAA